MNRAIKIARLTLGALAAAGFLGLRLLAKLPAVPKDYQKTIQTGGALEAKYLQNGTYAVSQREEPVPQNFERFLLYYPTELETSDKRYPVLVLCNGSGTPLSKYATLAEHYASWGFLVIGTEERYSWNAFGAELCLRYLERMNENQQIGEVVSPFYQRVDLERVGVVGHSQGAVGALNAVTNIEHKGLFQTAVALSPTNKELAHNLFWDYDANQVEVPTLLLSGAGGGDDLVVTGQQLQEIYADIPGDKLMLRRRDTPNSELLYKADGYVLAWVMWQLRGDEEAAKAFVGAAPEVWENPLYQDQEASWAH